MSDLPDTQAEEGRVCDKDLSMANIYHSQVVDRPSNERLAGDEG
jgi:hypothetical protein